MPISVMMPPATGTARQAETPFFDNLDGTDTPGPIPEGAAAGRRAADLVRPSGLSGVRRG